MCLPERTQAAFVLDDTLPCQASADSLLSNRARITGTESSVQTTHGLDPLVSLRTRVQTDV